MAPHRASPHRAASPQAALGALGPHVGRLQTLAESRGALVQLLREALTSQARRRTPLTASLRPASSCRLLVQCPRAIPATRLSC